MTTTTSKKSARADLEDHDKEARGIESFGLTYRRIEIPRDSIDLVTSQTWNARGKDRVDDEVVFDYALLWEQGVRFPRITVFYDKTLGKFVTVSGLHRASSHEMAGISTPLPAFEVLVDPPGDPATMDKIADLGVLLNSTGGFTLSHTEKVHAAIKAVHERGEDVDSVSERLGLKAEEISAAYENWKLDRELAHNGLDPSVFTRKTDKTLVLSLPSISWMREVQKLLRYTTPKGQLLLTGEALRALVVGIRAEKSETRRQELVAAVAKTLKAGGPAKKKPGPKAKGVTTPYFIWRNGATSIGSVSPSELVAARCVSADSAKDLLTELNQVREALEEIERATKERWPGH